MPYSAIPYESIRFHPPSSAMGARLSPARGPGGGRPPVPEDPTTQVSSYYVFTTKESKQLELIITPYKWIEIKCLHIPLFINLPILNK